MTFLCVFVLTAIVVFVESKLYTPIFMSSDLSQSIKISNDRFGRLDINKFPDGFLEPQTKADDREFVLPLSEWISIMQLADDESLHEIFPSSTKLSVITRELFVEIKSTISCSYILVNLNKDEMISGNFTIVGIYDNDPMEWYKESGMAEYKIPCRNKNNKHIDQLTVKAENKESLDLIVFGSTTSSKFTIRCSVGQNIIIGQQSRWSSLAEDQLNRFSLISVKDDVCMLSGSVSPFPVDVTLSDSASDHSILSAVIGYSTVKFIVVDSASESIDDDVSYIDVD